MNSSTERNLANHLFERFELAVPVDVFELAQKFAKVEFHNIPFNIDGACIGLKTAKPIIVINRERSFARTRFTAAHELGHVLLPTHFGDILEEQIYEDHNRSNFEREANQFAAELLLPTIWVQNLITQNLNQQPLDILKLITKQAIVSEDTALIKYIECAEKGIIYALCDNQNSVIRSGRSNNTFALQPYPNSHVKEDKTYPLQIGFWEKERQDGNILKIWKVETSATPAPVLDLVEWRIVLSEILTEITNSKEEFLSAQRSINAVVGAAFNDCKRCSASELNAAIIQRFHKREISDKLFRNFLEHEKSRDYFAKRIEELTTRQKPA